MENKIEEKKVWIIAGCCILVLLAIGITGQMEINMQRDNVKHWKGMYEDNNDSYVLFMEYAITESNDSVYKDKLWRYLYQEFADDEDELLAALKKIRLGEGW